jgi:hypothetical protein
MLYGTYQAIASQSMKLFLLHKSARTKLAISTQYALAPITLPENNCGLILFDE